MTSKPAVARCESCARRRAISRVIGEYGDGATALEEIRAKRPQLLFLDIQMSPVNGIDLARALAPDELPSLVFVTAYDTYALEAFEVCAVDYLLKPFDQERFRKTLARVRPRHLRKRRRRAPSAAGRAARATRARRPRSPEERPRLLAEFNGHLHVIDATQVELIEADRNYVADPGRARQLSRAQHLEPGGAGAALAADAAHQPLLSGQHELCRGGEPHPARRFHFGARRAARP